MDGQAGRPALAILLRSGCAGGGAAGRLELAVSAVRSAVMQSRSDALGNTTAEGPGPAIWYVISPYDIVESM